MVYGLDYQGEVSWNAPSVWEYELGIWRNYNTIKFTSISSFCSFPGHLQLLQTCIHHEYRYTFLLHRQFLLPCNYCVINILAVSGRIFSPGKHFAKGSCKVLRKIYFRACPSVLILFKPKLQERVCLRVKIILDCRHCSCSGKVTNSLVPQDYGLQCP